MSQPTLLGDRYELGGIVGRGRMAGVYRARDLRLDRIVAIKVLRPDFARDQAFQAQFRREAQYLGSLNHPSIAALYDTGEDMRTGTPVPYIVMEYVDGRTVRDLLIEGHRLLPERTLEIVGGALRALEYSHQAGIVHRDIKPEDVMVTRNGDIKVIDFGLALSMSDIEPAIQTAQGVGMAQYLSPEQVRGDRVDARSDLYSAGCLMYELLTGRPPFTGDSPVAIAYQHARENPIPPSRLDPDLPPWADAIVLKAMAKAPGDRYQWAAEMRADLQRAASGMPVAGSATRAPSASPGQRPAQPAAAGRSQEREVPQERPRRRGLFGSPPQQGHARKPESVFISYRRADSGPYARLLQLQMRDRIQGVNVFMDLDSIEAGLDFTDVIRDALGTCGVLVALIGPQWATVTDEGGSRRLDDPDDFVRFEIEAALERGVRVIPVLLDGARPLRSEQLPQSLRKLARLNAFELSHGQHYDYDAGRLLDLIQRVLRGPVG